MQHGIERQGRKDRERDNPEEEEIEGKEAWARGSTALQTGSQPVYRPIVVNIFKGLRKGKRCHSELTSCFECKSREKIKITTIMGKKLKSQPRGATFGAKCIIREAFT